MSSAEDGFRRLTIGEPALIAAVASREGRPLDVQQLDARTEALLQIGVLIALDAPPSSYRAAVEAAQRAGARLEELLAVLVAVAGTVGSARIVSAAPRIALAAGYDVEAELELIGPAGQEAQPSPLANG
jgi:alkylhydroperoxidase/carboxymuconolactone decarboxylase family protein YurZ